MNRWRVIWRAVARNRLTACIIVFGVIVVIELVMTHRYRLGVSWGPDTRFELAPAGPASSATLP